MSLVQLLSVGKSLLNIQDKPSPYRMRQENLLPNFGRAAKPGAEKSAWLKKEQTRKEPNVKDGQEVKVEQGRSLLGWVKGMNPFRRKAVKVASPLATAPVQVELLLDGVRPVRNDLHETDLMVVPARVAEKKEAPAQGEAEPVGAGGKAGSRVFGNK